MVLKFNIPIGGAMRCIVSSTCEFMVSDKTKHGEKGIKWQQYLFCIIG